MFDRLVKDVMDASQGRSLCSNVSVTAAAQLMARGKFGAVLVVEDDRLQGIFTERDALFRVIAQGLDPDATQLAQVMTAGPQTVGPNDTYGYALVMMQEGGFRHAPFLENGRPVGIVSSRNAMDPDLEEFVSEASRRTHLSKGR
jgi:CBS domain-containing protein